MDKYLKEIRETLVSEKHLKKYLNTLYKYSFKLKALLEYE